jgi:hypothetical protein
MEAVYLEREEARSHKTVIERFVAVIRSKMTRQTLGLRSYTSIARAFWG